MVREVWVVTSAVLIVALILPCLKKKDTTGNPRKEDVFFQVPALLVLTVILFVSFGNLSYPLF